MERYKLLALSAGLSIFAGLPAFFLALWLYRVVPALLEGVPVPHSDATVWIFLIAIIPPYAIAAVPVAAAFWIRNRRIAGCAMLVSAPLMVLSLHVIGAAACALLAAAGILALRRGS